MTLKDLKTGYQGEVLSIDGISQSRRRLIDMGITTGTVIQVLKTAPFGDPVLIRLRGYTLSLRKNETKMIKVEGVRKNETGNCTAWKSQLRENHAL